MRAYLLVFATVFLAELGDKTQLATVVFASSPDIGKAGVFAAAAAALVASAALAVLAGAWIGAWLPPSQLRLVAALGFIAIGVWMLVVR
jgi:putative Ca2+/H+ antiporter (TMEM165/GDT1 family)